MAFENFTAHVLLGDWPFTISVKKSEKAIKQLFISGLDFSFKKELDFDTCTTQPIAEIFKAVKK
jgi:hypothetical protein